MSREGIEFMGSRAEAREKLVEKARAYRGFQGAYVGTAADMRRRDRLEHEARNQLANAALLWLWHEESADA